MNIPSNVTNDWVSTCPITIVKILFGTIITLLICPFNIVRITVIRGGFLSVIVIIVGWGVAACRFIAIIEW